jgi:hypothetical protein
MNKHIKLYEEFVGSNAVNEAAADGYFIAQMAAGFLTGEVDKGLRKLEDWNNEMDIFPDWEEDGDDDIVAWAKKKFKDAGTSPSDFSNSFQSIWWDGFTKAKAEKELADLKKKGFTHYGVYEDPYGYGGMDIIVVAKKPLKTKDIAIDKQLDKILDDEKLMHFTGWGIK